MQSQYIIAGFTDIKSELRIKTRTEIDITDLHLWFTLQDNVLYVHNYSDHKICTALALYKLTENSWRVYLRPGCYGEQLVVFLTAITPLNNLAENFNLHYDLYGFSPFRRF